MAVPWNVTRRLVALLRSDVLIISPGKAGRTWLRVMLHKYFALRYDIEFTLSDPHRLNAAIPSLVYEHWWWSHFRVAHARERLLGKFVIPRPILLRKKVILLVRDPRDVSVSAYFQDTKRARPDRRIDMPLSEYIKHPRYGIHAVVRIMNILLNDLRNHPTQLLVRYEDLRADTFAVFERILRFIDDREPHARALWEAIAFADFENMRKMERNDRFKNRILQARDPSDPQSYKVRSGKVGGYASHFTPEEIEFLNQAMESLDPAFGYSTAMSATVERDRRTAITR